MKLLELRAAGGHLVHLVPKGKGSKGWALCGFKPSGIQRMGVRRAKWYTLGDGCLGMRPCEKCEAKREQWEKNNEVQDV